jgi:prepilin-type N-terminal cleavage/methylation domain-containing protein
MPMTRDKRHETCGIWGSLLLSPLRPLSGRNNNAFTLIEMIIVIAIISALLGLLYGALERAQKFSRRVITYTELKNIESAFKQYHAHYHTWPTNTLASVQFVSGDDRGFIIDERIAALLQGNRPQGVSANDIENFNPEMIPFVEFARYSTVTRAPVNPFKSNKPNPIDTTRAYKVLFDINGDRQIRIEDDEAPGFTTNIIANVAVWTLVPGTRKTDSSGNPERLEEEVFGSWDSFSVK